MAYTYALFSEFPRSMETSRTIRVGIRNDIIRIAAVWQEHVTVTRKIARPQNDMVLVLASNCLGCCVGGRHRLDFSVGSRTWLDLSVGIRIDVILWGSKITSFRVWIKINVVFVSRDIQNSLVFKVGIEIDLISVLESNFTRFCGGDCNCLGFSVRTEVDIFLVQGWSWPCFCVRVKN